MMHAKAVVGGSGDYLITHFFSVEDKHYRVEVTGNSRKLYRMSIETIDQYTLRSSWLPAFPDQKTETIKNAIGCWLNNNMSLDLQDFINKTVI